MFPVDLYKKEEEGAEDVLHSLADHKHEWEVCRHVGLNSKGSHPKCKQILSNWTHHICGITRCNDIRYPDHWGRIVTNILEQRRCQIEENDRERLIQNFVD